MSGQLVPGETVRLKSGGPLMTITTVWDEFGVPMAECYWFQGATRHEGRFPIASLEKDS